jgi:hypothetical protein
MQKIFIIALLAIGLGACSREGDFQEKASMRQMQIRSLSLAPDARFIVIINNSLITDSLVSTGVVNKLIKTVGETQHVVVKDYQSGSLLYDTLLSTPGTSFNINILQLDATGVQKPQFISGGQNDDIPENHILLSLYYDAPTMPESMAVTIYCIKQNAETFTYDGTDTLVNFAIVRKGQLAEFQLMDFSLDPNFNLYVFQPKDVATGEILPGGEMDAPSFYAPMLGIGATTDKHIICNIQGTDIGGGAHYFYGSPLISY